MGALEQPDGDFEAPDWSHRGMHDNDYLMKARRLAFGVPGTGGATFTYG
jgi:hypothetical protein